MFPRAKSLRMLERAKGFEPSTPTLARPGEPDFTSATQDLADARQRPACQRPGDLARCLLRHEPHRVVAQVREISVVRACLWPSTFPSVYRAAPSATATEAKEWRRSCIRTSAKPAIARTSTPTF